MIRRHISAKLGIGVTSHTEMEGTGVSRLHDEMESEARSLRYPKRVPQCHGRQSMQEENCNWQKRERNLKEIGTRHAQKQSSNKCRQMTQQLVILNRFRNKLNLRISWQNCGRRRI